MTDPLRLLAATGDGVSALERRGGGWEATPALEGEGIACVAAGAGGVVLAGGRGSGLHLSRDGGRSFEVVELPVADVFSVAVSAADGSLYAGTEPSRLFRAERPGERWRELEALQEIPSRESWSFPPRPWTSHVRWIAPSPHDRDRILIGIELGGVMLTDDGGESFADHRPGAVRDVHSLAWHPVAPDRAYETGGGGAAWSGDGGERWQELDDGLELHYCWALAVSPTDPELWWVSAAAGPMRAHGDGPAGAHLYRRRGERPWEVAAGGPDDPLDSMPYALAAVDGELVMGLRDGRLRASADQGESWEELPARLPAVMALAVQP